MHISFRKLPYGTPCPSSALNTMFLVQDNWDDYSYKTLFTIYFFDQSGIKHEIGNTKIGYVGQPIGWTESRIPEEFTHLPEDFFSLGQDSDFYRAVYKVSSDTDFTVEEILGPIRDVSLRNEYLKVAEHQDVFKTSLLRTVEQSSITQQFSRLLRDEAPWSKYAFLYERKSTQDYAGLTLEFDTKQDSEPPTNIHILIGRNGVGKTTILNNMVNSLLPERTGIESMGEFTIICHSPFITKRSPITNDYFAGIVSVSFSAFDPFIPPKDRSDLSQGVRYRYIGLKKETFNNTWSMKNTEDLGKDCAESLKICLALSSKRRRWLDAVKTLQSDPNFSEMPLSELVERFDGDLSETKMNFEADAKHLFSRMSSGHSIVLLTITSLIETVEEKTLVLIDEPESHLHPPLLSAFTRALSDLLKNRNGIAIIATHSPVVLQEVPRTCVSILNRTRLNVRVDRPNIETFGENVGVLTREVFELEVKKSGFHNILDNSVKDGLSYGDILARFKQQLGFEGRALLRAMVSNHHRVGGDK